MRLRWRLPLAFALASALLAGIVALASALMLRPLLLDRLEDDMARQAQQYAAVLAEGQATVDTLQTLTVAAGNAGEIRLTVIAHGGRVLADSEADPATLENHSARPEVAQALAGHEGRARRDSVTLHEQMVYVAIPLPAGDQPWSARCGRPSRPPASIPW
jgi:two-component system phosphate regulon sensor histidine kinase PhoR